MADGLEQIQDQLSAVTDEAKKALANLESSVKGGGIKKKVKKRRVDILYDSSGTRIIKTPRRASLKTAESANESTSSTGSNVGASSSLDSGFSVTAVDFIESVHEDAVDPAVEYDSEENDSMLQEAFDDAEKLIEANTAVTQITWQTRQTRLETNWEGFRANLAYYAICQEALTFPQHCSTCSVELDLCVVRCLDCGPGVLFCSECDMQVHDHNPIHDREAWNGNFFSPILPTEGVDSQGKLISVARFVPCSTDAFCCPKCEGSVKAIPSQSKCILINLKGRFDLHMPQMLCASCNFASEVSLVHLGYWPGSPTNASYFFDHAVFQFWDIMQKNMPGSSSSAFVKTLAQISEKKGRSGTITPATFSKAFQEWRYCQFELSREAGTDCMICPCCLKGQLACHMDGNRKTYRWKKVNTGSLESYYADTFFCDDKKVKNSLEQTYQHKSTKVNGQDSCGQVHWQAAKTKAKSLQKLDETGVMVAGCRHALMQKAVNMWTGEMYGYGFYLQKYVLPSVGVKFLFYDVICKYWPWMQKVCQSLNETADTSMIPALGQMHGKLHKWTCRVLFGSQWQDGAGLTTGEEMETAFQYLSRCGSTTKNMTRAGRMEHLTEHVLFWNERKILSLPKYLSLRYVKILREIETQSDELIKTGVTETVLKEWKNEIIRAAQDEEASTSGASDSERAEYFRLSQEIREAEALEQFSAVSSHSLSVLVGNSTFFNQAKQLLEDLEKKKLRLATLRSKLLLDGVDEILLENAGLRSLAESVAQTIRDKITCSMSLIRRRQEMINKEAAYSQQRSKLRKKNDAEKKALKEALSNYNNIVVHCDSSNGYVPVEEESVLSGNVAWDSSEGHLRDKMETVEVYNRLLRLREEKKQIETEMLSFLAVYKERAQQLTSEADLLKSTPCSEADERNVPETVNRALYSTNVQDIFIQAGKRALKLKGVQFCKTQIARGLQYFRRAVANDHTLLEELQDYEDYETIEEDNDMDEEEYTAEQMLSFGAVQHETDLQTDQNEPDFDLI